MDGRLTASGLSRDLQMGWGRRSASILGVQQENAKLGVSSWKNLTDAVARAAADALQGPIQSAYKEAFQSVVLPAFEKSCQSMFQQINDTFKQGTQECESCWKPRSALM